VIVEYALRDSGKPMGVAQYRLSPALPDQLKNDLPTAEDLAAVVGEQDQDLPAREPGKQSDPALSSRKTSKAMPWPARR